MLRLSQARVDQVKEITEDNFYEYGRFGDLYLCEGDELTYISMEDDDDILKRLHRGEKVVVIREDEE